MKAFNAPKQSVADLLCATLEGPAQQLAESLFRGPPLLDYSSMASRPDTRLMAPELGSRCATMNQRGEIQTIELSVTFLPSLSSPCDQCILDRTETIKAAKRQADICSNFIGKICLVPAASPTGDEDFIFLPAAAILKIGLSDASKSIIKPRRRTAGPSVTGFGFGFSFESISYENPSDAEIEQITRAFADVDRTLCILASKSPQALAEKRKWKNARFLRELGLLQLLSQIPIDKGYFGQGIGIDLLEHALVAPMSRAKQMKKEKYSISRAKLLNIWWRDKVDNPNDRNSPPFVTL
jgi:hypothetical protein